MPRLDPEDLAAWSGGAWSARPAAPILGVRHDSRAVRPGDLFVALRGARTDGREFLAQAFAAGASAALAALDAPGSAGPVLRVADPAAALAAIARGHRRRMGARRIGITGSVGKTSVKNLARAALSALGPTAGTPGNWNNALGLPLSLLTLGPEHAFGVFEVGMNHPGELRPLCELLAPEAAILTRIGPAHIEFFDSEEAIAEEKAALLDALPAGGFAVLAADEPWFDRLRRRAPCRVVTVACGGPADYRAVPDPAGVRIRERDGTEALYPVSMPGPPGRANTARAVALARELGAAPDALARALAGAPAEPGRWQPREAGGVLWIHDAYNANPLSVGAALAAFEQCAGAGRKWLVLGGMAELGDRAESEHRAIGRRLAAGPWAGLVTCGPLGAGFARGAQEAGMDAGRLFRAPDAPAAAGILRERLRPGDAVLLKGSRSERVESVLEHWARPPAGRAPEE